jgi:hypothetical protein
MIQHLVRETGLLLIRPMTKVLDVIQQELTPKFTCLFLETHCEEGNG